MCSSVARGADDKKKNVFVTPALDEASFDSLVKNLSDTLNSNPNQSGMLSTSNSADLLSISPIFGKPFHTQSLDEQLMTPVEDDLIRGIRNINYDIDFSESPENSLAEEIAEIRKYSSVIPSDQNKASGDGGGMSISKSDLEEFDPLMSKEPKVEPPPEVKNAVRSLIDESPTLENLLENPLLPMRNDYRGFSSQTSQIQSISCGTGQNTESHSKEK